MSYSLINKYIIVALLFGAAVVGPVFGGVVTFDAAAGKLVSDVSTIESLDDDIKVEGNQVGFRVQSKLSKEQSFILKVTGLKEPAYDLYLRGNYAGKKTIDELTHGVQVTIPGSIADPGLMGCMRAVEPKIKAERERTAGGFQAEQKRAFHLLGQVLAIVRAAINNDQMYRSMEIVLAPEGSVLKPMSWWIRPIFADDITYQISNSARILREARDRMYTDLKEVELRNSVVAALTPVDMTAVYAVEKGKPRITVRVVNSCNYSVKGTITMALPKGWKSSTKKNSFSELKTGKEIKLVFDLVGPAGTEAPSSVPVAANITVNSDVVKPEFKIKTQVTKS